MADSKPTDYNFYAPAIPIEVHQAVGLLISCASNTEDVLGQLIGALLKIDFLERLALVTHLTMPQRFNIARSLLEVNVTDIDVLDRFDDLLDNIEDVFKKRNAVVHDPLCINLRTEEVFFARVQARGRLDGEFRPVTAEAIRADAAEIYKAGTALWNFMQERGLDERPLTRPLPEQLNRRKKAREERQERARSDRDRVDGAG